LSGRLTTILALLAALLAFGVPTAHAASLPTVASGCRQPLTHHGPIYRDPTPTQIDKIRDYCQLAHHNVSTLRFWYSSKHRWSLYLNQSDQKCWQLKLSGPVGLCVLARAEVRRSTRALAWLNGKIEQLTRPQLAAWLKDAFLCIHRHEGSWRDHGYPYWGGLQEDWNFMQAYGPEFLVRWGTADHWPIWAQLMSGARAYASGRGFGPWPNTRIPCGV
jgi:hypothetical protein